MTQCNYLTIDVEDYFQVSAFESIVSKENWDEFPSRVEHNTEKVLGLLAKKNIQATFFIVGWTANKYPDLVKLIAKNGHEIGCHSYYHRLVYDLTPEEFRNDTYKAKDTLEQIIGKQVHGYRAPSYSITKKSLWALNILHELGFTYDSSIFPIVHDRYGLPDAPRFPFLWDLSGDRPVVDIPIDLKRDEMIKKYFESSSVQRDTPSTRLLEFPISTSLIFGKKIPVSGGGYFRLFPYWFTKYALSKINSQENNNFVFYLHPWEVDPEQPRLKTASMLSKFRHYINLGKTLDRFDNLSQDFSFGPMYNHVTPPPQQ